VNPGWVAPVTLAGGALGAGASRQLRRGKLSAARRRATAAAHSHLVDHPALAAAYAVLAAIASSPQNCCPRPGLPSRRRWVVWIDLDVHRIPNRVLAVAAPAVAVTGWAGALRPSGIPMSNDQVIPRRGRGDCVTPRRVSDVASYASPAVCTQ